MSAQAKVLIIGGGIAGCSTLFHLTELGMTDVLLVERDQLTSGTTWHSAAQVTNFGVNQTMIGLKSHSIQLYQQLAADADFPITYHHADGGIRLAGTPEQLDGYHHFASVARGMGVYFEVLDAAECARRHPLISTDNLLGGLWDPLDGDIDPTGLCHALIRRAKKAGAQVRIKTQVNGLTQHADGSWLAHTDSGDINCEIVVNACGYRAGEVGAMMGVHHPSMAMEHQYLITEPIDEIKKFAKRTPLLRCPISDFYCRQEKHGLLVGFYEQECRDWGMDGIDPNFSNALCPDDIERVSDAFEGALARLPALQTAGIQSVVNGPITYTIDGAPLVGPIPHKRNAYCIIGLRAGIGEGGGHGWLLAQQIVNGEACYDTWCIDPRRFADHANVELCRLKAIEDYQNEFRFHFPNEQRPAGRNAKTSPLHEHWRQLGASFGVVAGWERIDYFKPEAGFTETLGFRFNETFEVVKAEIAALQKNVGVTEINGFNRIQISGKDATAWLDSLSCTALSHRPNRVQLAYFLNELGNLKTESTLAYLPDQRIWFGSAAAGQVHDFDWLSERLPKNGDVHLTSLADTHSILLIAGPRARALLASVARGDFSRAAFGWLGVKTAFIGYAPAVVMAVSYSGEEAFELHIELPHLYNAYSTLKRAGEAFGLTTFGARAIESMRLEKGYHHFKAELITEYNPFEIGLARFVDMNKDFIGKAALVKMQAAGCRRRLVMLVLESNAVPAHGGASVMHRGDVCGAVASAAFGHRTGENLAFAFVAPEYAAVDAQLCVDVLGDCVAARVVHACRYDSKNELLKG